MGADPGRRPESPAGSGVCALAKTRRGRRGKSRRGLRHPSPRPAPPGPARPPPTHSWKGTPLPAPPGALGPPSPGEQDGAMLQRAAAHRPPALPDQLGLRALHARPGDAGRRAGTLGERAPSPHVPRHLRGDAATRRLLRPPRLGRGPGGWGGAADGPATAASPPRWRRPRRPGASRDPGSWQLYLGPRPAPRRPPGAL